MEENVIHPPSAPQPIITPTVSEVIPSNDNDYGIGPAVGSMGIGSMVVLIVVWAFGLHGIVIPSDVAIAMGGLISAGLHYVQDRYIGQKS